MKTTHLRSIQSRKALSLVFLTDYWLLLKNSYLAQYSLILTTMIVISTASYIYYLYGSLRASRKIGASLVDSILGSTLRWVRRTRCQSSQKLRISRRWLDETPTGRIIARCTQDIRAVDGTIPEQFMMMIELAITLLTKLVVIIIFTPIFLLPGIFTAVSGFFLGNLYLRAQLSVRREMRYAIAVLPLCTVYICYSAMHVPH